MSNEMPPPAAMIKIVTAYWLSQAVGTVARLGVADLLEGGPRSAEDLAAATSTNADALFRVLRCCASVGIFRAHDGRRFSLTPLGDTLKSSGPGSMRDFAIAETSPGHWLPWGKLDSAVKNGKPATHETLGTDIFGFYAKHPDEAAPFARAMGNLSAMAAAEVARVCDFSRAKTVVDVGGANGALLAAVLDAQPSARGIVFDLPHVAEDARALIGARGLASRAEFAGGDFFQGVPRGDTLLLKQVLHDWDDESSLRILARCRAALQDDGKLVVVEMVLPEDNAPSMAQMMDLNMLVMLTGRERSEADFAALFAKAGLRLAKVSATHSPFFVIEAVPA